jgi:hypothetical protein
VCSTLEAAGLPCWIAPRDIAPGAEWASAIVDAVGCCRCALVLVSRHSMGSRQVAREVELHDRAQRPLLAVRIDDGELAGPLSYFLLNTQWYDCTAPNALAGLPGAVHDLLSPDALEAVEERPAAPGARPESPARSALVELRRVAAAWIGVVGRGPRFVESLEVEDLRTVTFAVRFLAYMQVLSAVIALTVTGPTQPAPARYLLTYTVSGFVESAGAVLILYGVFRAFGGAGSLAASAAVCLLYNAFEPILAVVVSPARFYLEPFFRLDLRTATPEDLARAFQQYATPILIAVLLTCMIAATLVLVLASVNLTRSLRSVHRISNARAAFAMFCGCAAFELFAVIMGTPFERSLFP